MLVLRTSYVSTSPCVRVCTCTHGKSSFPPPSPPTSHALTNNLSRKRHAADHLVATTADDELLRDLRAEERIQHGRRHQCRGRGPCPRIPAVAGHASLLPGKHRSNRKAVLCRISQACCRRLFAQQMSESIKADSDWTRGEGERGGGGGREQRGEAAYSLCTTMC